MKKKLVPLLILLLLLPSCHKDGISKPKNIKLDLWLLDDVTQYDFSSLTLLNYYKFMDIEQYKYLDSHYLANSGDTYFTKLPEIFVVYTVERHLTNESDSWQVTSVNFSDSRIKIYNVGVGDYRETLNKKLQIEGWTLECEYCSGFAPYWQKGAYTIFCSNYFQDDPMKIGNINISVSV